MFQVVEFVLSLQFISYPKIGEAEGIPATNSQIECDAIPTEVKKVSTAGKSCILKLLENQYLQFNFK